MNSIKYNLIKLSPYYDKYKNLILNNCIILKDDVNINNILYNIIIYGNFKINNKISLHTRLNTIKDIEKHQLANEFNKLQNNRINVDKLILLFIFVIICQYLIKLINIYIGIIYL